MVPIAQLIKEHEELVRQLRRYSFPDTAQIVAGLSLCPELCTKTVRIEVLQHLVAISCVGKERPTRESLKTWMGKHLAESFAAQMEDPVEDVFVGCINSDFGSFRAFTGVLADWDFWTERLLGFLAKNQSFPPFKVAIKTLLPLLRISDVLADRVGLMRYSPADGSSSAKIQIPQWRKVLACANAVHFSATDLETMGIDFKLLEEFTLTDQRKTRLRAEELWNSSLERYPLIGALDGVIIATPNSLVRAAIRFLLEHITKNMGGWADTFFKIETATLFVNEVRMRLKIQPMDFKPPPWPDGLQPMFPYFGQFDYGKPAILLTHCIPLSKSADDFNAFEEFSDDGKLQEYLRACADEFEKIPEFSGGLVLVCMAGISGGFVASLNQSLTNWHIEVATLPEWLILTSLGDCTAMRLWKLGEHEAVLHSHGVKTINLSGLLNLYAFWKSNGFRLAPKDTDSRSLNLLTIGSDFGAALRTETKKRTDIHCVRSHDNQHWVKLTRHNAKPLFKEDGEIPLYADLDSARAGRLTGCIKGACTNWWVVAPPRNENPNLANLAFRLWECVEAWVARVSVVVAREWPNFCAPSAEIEVDLPNLAKWDDSYQKIHSVQGKTLSMSVDREMVRIVLTIPEGFMPRFSMPKNLAESEIVVALLMGSAQLAGSELADERALELSREILRNEDARYFHIVQARGIEQMVAGAGRPEPLFIHEEDFSLVRQGLADLVGRPAGGKEIAGLDACKEYLKDTVTKVWERIETRLKPFNREFVVMCCFEALDEIARDEEQWDMTTRSQFALHRDMEDVHNVLLERRSDRAKASLCNRLIIETAQYACRLAGGRMFTEADHLTILADMTLLILLANHRDGIAYGFLKPKIRVAPNGELQVDEKFYRNVMGQYMTKRGRVASEEAASDYENHFPWILQPKSEATIEEENALNEFDKVFAPEFGFSVHLLLRALDELRAMAVKTDRPRGKMAEDMMQSFLRSSGFNQAEAEAFLDRFTLLIRSAWDAELPPRCHQHDVFPWRFRLQLSLHVRPLVQVGVSPRAWIISVPTFEKSVSYVIGHLEQARFPKDFFHSAEMHTYIGDVTNKRGHAFTKKVGKVFVESGCTTKLEIEMTQLGAAKKLGLGDVDVLSWEKASGRVYAVECKRLLTANSVGEVVQRLEEFRGNKKEMDSLGRHLRRLDWLRENPHTLARFIVIPCERIRLIPLVVTSAIMPMQFFEGMKIPTSQVLSFDELSKRLDEDRTAAAASAG